MKLLEATGEINSTSAPWGTNNKKDNRLMSKASSLERQMLDLINAERASRNLNPLQLELRLNDAAEDHSQWMINTDRFSHTGAGGSSPRDRMEDANFNFTGNWLSAENIAWQSVRGQPGLADDVINLHQSLMNSSGHRANILNPNTEVIGIGIERGDYNGWDALFVTQNFARTSAPLQIDQPGSTPQPLPPAPNNSDQQLNGTGVSNILAGASGDDTLNGNGGNDTLRGNDGNDLLNGGTGADKLSGGRGSDAVIGGDGNDVLRGNHGRDDLQGGNGRDRLIGGSQADVLDGGDGNDILIGGKHNDRFVFSNDHGRDKIVDFDALTAREKIDLRDIDAFDSYRDVKQAATQINNHVRIETGDDNWITLMNTQLSQLDSGDFLV